MDNNNRIDITEEFNKANGEVKKNKWKERKDAALQWCSEHKDVVIGGAIAGIGLLKTIMKVGGKAYTSHMEHVNKDLRCYDTSLGRYWDLKRKLSNRDWLEIDRRRSKGERLGDILNDLHALR